MPTSSRFSCLLIGGQSRLIQCGTRLLQKGHVIRGVVSPDPAVRQWAEERDLPAFDPDHDLVALLQDRPVDYLFSIDNPLIVPDEALTLPRRYAVNFHDGPLPRYAGVHAANWAIINRETVHGVTWHVMTPVVDAGDILKQTRFPISDKDTAFTLNGLCYAQSLLSFDRLIDDLAEDRIKPIRQPLEEGTYFPRWKRPPAACAIDWAGPAEAIDALCRGLDHGDYPNPLGLPKLFLGGRAVVVKRADVLSSASASPPGTILTVTDEAVHVATRTRDVALHGFFAFDGRALAPAAVLATAGLREGDTLPQPAKRYAEALSTVHRAMCRHEAYWIRRLADLEPLEIPYAKRRTPEGAHTRYLVSRYDTPVPAWPGQAESESPGDTVLAAFLLYLCRIGGKDRFDVHFRDEPLRQALAGTEAFFASHVPLRVETDLTQPFGAFCDAIRRQAASAASRLSYARDLPLRDPALRAADRSGRRLLVAIERVAALSGDPPEVDADLAVVIPDDGRLCDVWYHPAALDETDVTRMQAQFTVLLRAIASEPDRPVLALSILTEQERHTLLTAWNDTAAPYPRDACLHQLIEAQVARTPDAVAVECEGASLTYRELDDRANRLANHLRGMGVEPGRVVGICLERAPEMVVGLLGIMKAGGAYLPLDPAYPAHRIAFMLKDSAAAVLVTQESLTERLPTDGVRVVCVDRGQEAMACAEPRRPARPIRPGDPVYIVYTSGSTGQPKGAAATHGGLINFLWAMRRELDMTDRDVLLSVTTISFDIASLELFLPLIVGARVALASRETAMDGARLMAELDRTGATVMQPPLATWRLLLQAGWKGRPGLKMTCGGEPLSRELANELVARGAKVLNCYGTTETTVCSLVWRVEPGDGPIKIGRPIVNNRVYILDRHLQPVPVGVPGELHIGGVQVSPGYVNRPELTAGRFIPDPFSGEPDARLYRTGDVCRYLPDGHIEYLGRNDFQVKIRGFRIETGEIESVLSRHPAVREAVVQAREYAPGDPRLVAYLLPKKPAPLHIGEVRRFLRERLPEYMMPAAFMVLDAFPLTPSGKIDRRALPAPVWARQTEKAYTAPENEVQRIVAGIWRDLLPVDRVGIHDTFFELGGHSLLLTDMVTRLNEALGIELSIVDAFRHPTVATLSECAARRQRNAPAKTGPSGRTEPSKTVSRQTQTGSAGQGTMEEIAVIGLAGRFPGAKNVEAFWRNLRDGVDAITRFTDEALETWGVPAGVFTRPDYVKAGTVLDDMERFDASFFGYSPGEAVRTDPQHRIFLECAWEALEHAGYDPARCPVPVGVFAGSNPNDYGRLLPAGPQGDDPSGAFQMQIGNGNDFLATRVSHRLNLKGPSLTVQTACSTSLVAVQLACQSLQARQCGMALAGGVSVNLRYRYGYVYQEGMILSPDGVCRAFDADARGTVLGQGAGIVVLKRLSDALADGDTIHAVIKGAAVNNDGADKIGFAAPSVDGQARVIAEAQALSGVAPGTIGYIEAHGTGTPLGDPVEIEALTQAFRTGTDKKGFCAIGSVKTNIGHLDAAAGIAGLIKTILALKYKEIPPSLHFETPNPHIDFENSPFYVNTRLTPWPEGETPRRAGVSSFGIGGTNAHVVLEEAPAPAPATPARPWQALLWSARTETALEAATANLAGYLERHPDAAIQDAAYTLQAGRHAFAHRRLLVCRNREDALEALRRRDPARLFDGCPGHAKRPVAFMFSGQGSQYVNMGRALYRTEAVFRQYVDRCAELLRPHLSRDIRALLYPPDLAENPAAETRMDTAARALSQTAMAQPALFTVEYALAQLWMAWGIQPEAMIGHSIGEYTAACLSGVFSLEDALTLVAARGRLMQTLPAGAMLAVSLPPEETQPLLNGCLDLAAVNGPSLCAVSGPTGAIEALEADLAAKAVPHRRLHTSHAFHSRMMDPILPVFMEQVKRFRLQPPRIPFVSNLTGVWITDAEAADPRYWAGHLRHTVRFAEGIDALRSDPGRVLLEVGPGHTLTTLARQATGGASSQDALSSLPHPGERQSDNRHITTTLGRLWLAGVPVDWDAVHRGETRRRIPLPAYPFERKRYWAASRPRDQTRAEAHAEATDSQASPPSGAHPAAQASRPAPQTEEQTLVQIWKRLLGTDRVGAHDNFFDLGGHSLMAVQLFAEIERTMGRRLPLSALLEAPTIVQLAGMLRRHEAVRSASVLTPIQPEGFMPPFFCVHGHSGNVLNFAEVARHLGNDRPFYGLQAIGVSGDRAPLTRIEAMAARYIEEIRSVQPEGPYYIGGYCFGSVVALEMACQLRVQGHDIARLIMLDPLPALFPGLIPSPVLRRFNRYAFRANVARHASELAGRRAGERLRYLVSGAAGKMAKQAVRVAYILIDAACRMAGRPLPRACRNIERIHKMALSAYRPHPFPGRVTLLLSKPVTARYTDDPERDWAGLAAGGVEAHLMDDDGVIAGGGMFRAPYVRALAERLAACLSADRPACRHDPRPGAVQASYASSGGVTVQPDRDLRLGI